MEYVNAPNLQSYCERRRNTYCNLDYIDARRVLYGMADALSFIHRKGITHDDIKPANILYSKDRGPVLIDFGWSLQGMDTAPDHRGIYRPNTSRAASVAPPAIYLPLVSLYFFSCV